MNRSPPPYESPGAMAPPSAPTQSADDAKKSDRQYWLFIDRSGSMTTKDCGARGTKSRWKEAEEVAEPFAAFCEENDSTGAHVLFFNDKAKTFKNMTADKIPKIFDPQEGVTPFGGTNLYDPLKAIMEDHFNGKRERGLEIVIISDGLPDDEQDIIDEIVDVTYQMTRKDEMSILFVQIGKDPHAKKFLHGLCAAIKDGGLKDSRGRRSKFNIVSAMPEDKVEEEGGVANVCKRIVFGNIDDEQDS